LNIERQNNGLSAWFDSKYDQEAGILGVKDPQRSHGKRDRGATWKMVVAFPIYCNFKSTLKIFSAITTLLKTAKHLSSTHLHDNTISALAMLHSPADLWITSRIACLYSIMLRTDELRQLHSMDNCPTPIEQDSLSTAVYRLSNQADDIMVACSPRLFALLEDPKPQQEGTSLTILLDKNLKVSHSSSSPHSHTHKSITEETA
jgi:hypothetical protein